MSDIADESSLCQHQGCNADVTHHKSEWVTSGHMLIRYYCGQHAPADAEPIEDQTA